MRRWWAAVLALAAVAGKGDGAWGQPAAGDAVVFSRDWAVQAVPYYEIAVRGDGTGAAATVRGGAGAGAGEGVVPIRVSEATRAKLFAVGPVVSAGRCEGGPKHTAQTGVKVLTVRVGGVGSTCTFNYAEDKRVQEAVAAFAGIEATVEEGPKLEKLLRYDRLGLDAELGALLQLVKDGRAIEVGNLAPVLNKIGETPEVMERARTRAGEVLLLAAMGK